MREWTCSSWNWAINKSTAVQVISFPSNERLVAASFCSSFQNSPTLTIITNYIQCKQPVPQALPQVRAAINHLSTTARETITKEQKQRISPARVTAVPEKHCKPKPKHLQALVQPAFLVCFSEFHMHSDLSPSPQSFPETTAA